VSRIFRFETVYLSHKNLIIVGRVKMKKLWLLLSSMIGVIFLIASCAPKAEQPSKPSQVVPAAPQAISTSIPTSNLPPPTSQDAAWAKVVQAAKKEGSVNAYAYAFTGDVGVAVSRSFEQKYGIKLEIITGGGAALAERINTEKRMGVIVGDIMDANTFQIGNIKISGATASSEDIPALGEKDVWSIEPWANDPQKHILIHTLLFQSNLINTNLVKPGEEPRSIKDLAQSKWKGKMVQFDPKLTSSLSTTFISLLQRKLIDEETVREIGKGINFTSTSDEAAKQLIQGRYAIQPGISGRGVSPLLVQEPNLPIKLVDIEEGVVVSGNAMAAINNAPHPNAAKVLINWLLSKEGQAVFQKAQGATSVRKDVPDFLPASLRLTPNRIIFPTIEEERESLRLFREGYLAKLWGR